jgi:hypothetical protein
MRPCRRPSDDRSRASLRCPAARSEDARIAVAKRASHEGPCSGNRMQTCATCRRSRVMPTETPAQRAVAPARRAQLMAASARRRRAGWSPVSIGAARREAGLFNATRRWALGGRRVGVGACADARRRCMTRGGGTRDGRALMPCLSCSRCWTGFRRAAVDSEGALCPRCAAPLVVLSRLRPPVVGPGCDRLVALVQRMFAVAVADAQRTCSGDSA